MDQPETWPRTSCAKCAATWDKPGDYGRCNDEEPHAWKPCVGLPGTVHLYTDSYPVVLTDVTAAGVVVARVAYDASTQRQVNNVHEPWPCMAWDPELPLRILGKPERFRIVGARHYRGVDDDLRLTLGKAVMITDYRR